MRLTRRRWKFICMYLYVCVLFAVIQTSLHLAFLKERNVISSNNMDQQYAETNFNLTVNSSNKGMMKNIQDMNILDKEPGIPKIPNNQRLHNRTKNIGNKMVIISPRSMNLSANNAKNSRLRAIQQRAMPNNQKKEVKRNIPNKNIAKVQVKSLKKGLSLEQQAAQRKVALEKQRVAAEKLKKYKPKKNITHCRPLVYANPPLPITVLASFPGSGNTWLRHLLQEATGLLTGSFHPDPYLLNGPFPGEKTNTGKVLVVKSHYAPSGIKKWDRAIVILRNPFRSLLADFNRHNPRSSNEHTGYAPAALFRGYEWKRQANTVGANWYHFYDSWLSMKKPLLVMTYEDLINNTKSYMEKVLKFLNIKVAPEHFNCMLKNTEGLYHRKKKELEYDVYDKKQVELTNIYLDIINEQLKERFNVTVSGAVPRGVKKKLQD